MRNRRFQHRERPSTVSRNPRHDETRFVRHGSEDLLRGFPNADQLGEFVGLVLRSLYLNLGSTSPKDPRCR